MVPANSGLHGKWPLKQRQIESFEAVGYYWFGDKQGIWPYKNLALTMPKTDEQTFLHESHINICYVFSVPMAMAILNKNYN